MAKKHGNQRKVSNLITAQPVGKIEVLPPESGVVGRFIEDTQNMLKARAMRMKGLLARIDDSGQRTEALLRMAADRMEAARWQLEQDFVKEGLISDPATDGDDPD